MRDTGRWKCPRCRALISFIRIRGGKAGQEKTLIDAVPALLAGDTVVFNVDKLAGTTISTTTPDLVELTQGGEQDGAEFNPGAKALAAGTAVVTVTNPDSSMRDVTITISE
jgi:hypothetical protein